MFRCVFTIVGGVRLLRVLRLGVMHDDKDGLLYTAARGAVMNDVLARPPECPTRVFLPLVRRGNHDSVSIDFDSISHVNLSQEHNEV